MNKIICKTKKYFFRTVLILILSLLFTQPALTAEIFVNPKDNLVPSNFFKAEIIIDTENKEINAIEGEIVFPSKILEVKNINESSSIISLWIERPYLESENHISFSGVTPGGFIGKYPIFAVIFEIKKSASGIIDFKDIKALLNDGLGSLVDIRLVKLKFSVEKQWTQVDPTKIEDEVSPEPFTPIISRGNIFEGKYFLSFATQDKNSGIDHYEIKEGKKGEFIITESPYILEKQKLTTDIYIKAIDKMGNERLVVVEAQRIPLYKKIIISIIILFGLIFAFSKKARGKKN